MMEGLSESSSNKRKSTISDVDTNVTKKQKRGPILGIDLGTTFSCVAVFNNGHYEVIPNTDGERTTPSVVSYENDRILVGNAAKDAANRLNIIYDAKRLIGRKFDDSCIKNNLKFWPFKVVNKDNKCFIALTGNTTTLVDPVDVSSEVLKYLKRMAEEYLDAGEISDAVITVPAYFNDLQRGATKDTGKQAGFKNIIILNEPTAAALAFGVKANSSEEEDSRNMLVFDLGGGTFDVSLLTYVNNNYSVKCINGDNHLRGQDFTNAVVDYCLNFLKLNRNTVSDYLLEFLKEECKRTKCSLSTRETRIIKVPVQNDIVDVEITRDCFEKLINDYLLRIMEKVIKTIEDSGFDKKEIDDIIFVGGSSRIPIIQYNLEKYFGKKGKKTINADEPVAIGAAIAGVKAFTNNQPEADSIELVDVTPLSIGVGLRGGIMDPIIERNSKIPVTKSKIYTANPRNKEIYDLQIKIFQGERLLTEDNTFLGKMILPNLRYNVENPPSITIDMTCTRNGTCKIVATDDETNIAKEIILQDIYEPQNVEVSINESAADRSNDTAKVKAIRAQYKLQDLCYASLAKLQCGTYNDHEDLEQEISDILKTIPTLDPDSLETQIENLKRKMNKVFNI